MRSDALGFFWEDMPVEKGKRERGPRPMPAIPESSWKPVKDFPNLSTAKVIGLDTETFDPELLQNGPGWGRGVGHMIGASLSTEDGSKWYLPFRHELQKELNFEPENVLAFLRDTLKTNVPKVGANLQYDIGWLKQEGVIVNGPLYDVQYAEALLYDTAKSYALEDVAQRWLGIGKTSNELYEWLAQAYGGKPDSKQRANLYRSPTTLAGPYAESDATLPIQILKRQWIELDKAGLLNLFKMECKLIPILIGMRMRGMPVDIGQAEKVKHYLRAKEKEAQQKLNIKAGFEVGVYTPDDLKRLFDSKGYSYPLTAKGAPSFRKDWLSAQTHDVAGLVNTVRKYAKAQGTFVQNAILDKQVNGVLRPSLHPLRGEDGGAVSGRFSSSHPNGQQQPSRDKELAPLIRGCFIPEEGCTGWIKQDLSQIEYRFFAHFSYGLTGSERLIQEYQHPDTDYHAIVSSFLNDLLPRKPIKNFNFMSLFGGGESKAEGMLRAEFTRDQAIELLLTLGADLKGSTHKQLAREFMRLYEENFPAAKESLERDLKIAEQTGEIRTILNRRSTFTLWEPSNRRYQTALPYHEALIEYGAGIKRAFSYRALNRRLQGSAADLLKKGMIDCYEAGLFDKVGFPHITVHDELDFSYHPDLHNYFEEIRHTIENAIPLRVPIIMESEIGPNWGAVK